MKTSLKALCIMTIGSFAPCFAQIVSDIGYESPAAALAALREDPDATISTQEGWTIVSVQGENELALWSFTPESQLLPVAHP